MKKMLNFFTTINLERKSKMKDKNVYWIIQTRLEQKGKLHFKKRGGIRKKNKKNILKKMKIIIAENLLT